MPFEESIRILQRKLAALFPDPRLQEKASALLASYGGESHEMEAHRVRLAVLRLAGDDLAALAHCVALARRDYRDILAEAEFPRQIRSRSRLGSPQRLALAEADRADYEEWLVS